MEDLQYVGFWARFWASVVDIVLFMMILYPIFYLMYGNAFMSRAADFSLVNTFVGYLLPFIAVLVLWHYKSATPGKMFIKAKIVDATTLEKPTTKQFIIRNLGYYVSLLPLGLGYFWAGWDAKKQAWHDKLAHTVVIQPKQVQKKKTIGSYIAIGFGVFAMVLFMALMVIGFMSQSGVIPDGDLYTNEKLPETVRLELKSKDILEEGEVISYYQPESMFSYLESGTVFTQKGIHYFETNEEGEVIVWDFPFDTMGKLVLENEDIALGIELITIEIYDKEGEFLFSNALTPRSGQAETFIRDVKKAMKEERDK